MRYGVGVITLTPQPPTTLIMVVIAAVAVPVIVAEDAVVTKTIQWLGQDHKQMTDVDKAICYHEHEAKRNQFFGNKEQVKYHKYMVRTINKSKLLPKFD